MTTQSEYTIIPTELLTDIKICLRYGCDGTLPNEGELLRAIEKYSYQKSAPTNGCLCSQCKIKSEEDDEFCYGLKVHDAAIRKAERERVLLEYAAWDDTRYTTQRINEFRRQTATSSKE